MSGASPPPSASPRLNLAAYQKFVQPWIKGMVTPQMAEWMRNLHPLRLQYEAFSSQNPWMSAVKSAAEKVEDNRKPVSKDNPFLAFQEQISKQIVHALDSWRDFAGGAERGDLPQRLWFARAAGGGRDRSEFRTIAPPGDAGRTPCTAGEADRRA